MGAAAALLVLPLVLAFPGAFRLAFALAFWGAPLLAALLGAPATECGASLGCSAALGALALWPAPLKPLAGMAAPRGPPLTGCGASAGGRFAPGLGAMDCAGGMPALASGATGRAGSKLAAGI